MKASLLSYTKCFCLNCLQTCRLVPSTFATLQRLPNCSCIWTCGWFLRSYFAPLFVKMRSCKVNLVVFAYTTLLHIIDGVKSPLHSHTFHSQVLQPRLDLTIWANGRMKWMKLSVRIEYVRVVRKLSLCTTSNLVYWNVNKRLQDTGVFFCHAVVAVLISLYIRQHYRFERRWLLYRKGRAIN